MKRLSWIFFSFILAGATLAWAGPGTSSSDGTVTLAGATWGSDFEQAKREAQATGKPILLFDMVGRLDEQWC